MKKDRIDTLPAAAATLTLGQWLGRREAFGAVAGRCSAAEIECLHRLRNEKLYRGHARTWREFCEKYLCASRRTVDANIRLFDELGPAYFRVAQLAYLTPAEYRAIAARICAEGLEAGGETVPLAPENRDRIAAVISEVRARAKKAPPARKPAGFEAALEHCRAAAAQLETLFTPPSLDRQFLMVAALNRIRAAAARLGILGPEAQMPTRR